MRHEENYHDITQNNARSAKILEGEEENKQV